MLSFDGKRLKKLREKKKWTRMDAVLAMRDTSGLVINPQSWDGWETEKYGPSAVSLAVLEKIFDSDGLSFFKEV